MAANISKNDKIGDILDRFPDAAKYFLSMGMHCLGCPSARGETLEQACGVHGVDCDRMLETMNRELGN